MSGSIAFEISSLLPFQVGTDVLSLSIVLKDQGDFRASWNHTASSHPILNIDPAFVGLCLNFKQEENSRREVRATPDIVVFDADRLTDKYPYAWTDFYPSRAPCVYKSGPVWKVRQGSEEQGIVREPRTVCRPDIAPVWVSILEQIIANKGEEELLCTFLLSVTVTPRSLDYDDAVVAAIDVKTLLAKSGLPEAEVAFVEMVNKSLGGGLKLLPLDPVFDSVSEYQKHFSPVLGLPTAPLKMTYREGTGALYYRLNSDTKGIALLTCAHVVRPPPAFPRNNGMKRTSNSQPKAIHGGAS